MERRRQNQRDNDDVNGAPHESIEHQEDLARRGFDRVSRPVARDDHGGVDQRVQPREPYRHAKSDGTHQHDEHVSEGSDEQEPQHPLDKATLRQQWLDVRLEHG